MGWTSILKEVDDPLCFGFDMRGVQGRREAVLFQKTGQRGRADAEGGLPEELSSIDIELVFMYRRGRVRVAQVWAVVELILSQWLLCLLTALNETHPPYLSAMGL